MAFAGVTFLVLVAALLDVTAIALTFVIVRALVDPASTASLPVIAYLFRHEILGPLRWLPVSLALLYFAFILAKNLYGLAVTWYQERLFARLAAALGRSLLASYLDVSWNDMSRRKTSDLINVADVAGGPTLPSVLRAYLTLANELSMFAAVLALLLWIAPWPTLLSIVLLGPLFAFAQRGIRGRVEDLGRICTELANDRLQFFQQCLESGREIRISGRVAWFVARFADLRMREAMALQRIMSLQSIPRYLAEPILFGAITLVIIFIALTSPQSNVALPTLGTFAAAGFRLLPSISRSLSAGATLLGFAYPVSLLRADLALQPEHASGPGDVQTFEHEIVVRSISYRYPDRREEALSDVSFSLSRGDAVAIVGESGAGKSTLADIVVGLRRPDSGQVCADDVDISANLNGWRSTIGYVPQVVSLFDAGLRDNVAFGVDTAAIDDGRVREVLSLVQLNTLLDRLGGSLSSQIGERGTSVSVGERQRIGIARALYDRRQILVMDEATAALDENTEDLLGSAIEGLLGRCTVLIIAHRLATIRRCRKILMLENGRVIDSGGYEELLARCAKFAKLVRQGAFGTARASAKEHY
jgi:ABC-type multidrug transport system fused ATPase/permease subunit